MTAATEIVRRDPTSFGGARPPAISQATAIEQSRAIAEVQAAVVVAQSCPRDMASAEHEMEYVCGRLDMAMQAFYQVDNRGTGPSVHLMRELARIWGNIDYGVKELHRDDESGNSEVQAFAWDVQRNTRSSRTFINPHARMKGRGAARERVQLVDLTDIYLSNQNIGARAVRECISTILPRWFTEKAQEICQRTLEHGEGEPLQDRINTMVEWFGQMGVSVAQLEARAGRAQGSWDARDVAQFKIAGKSINAGEARIDDLFPPIEGSSSTADEIVAAAPDPEEKPKRPRKPRAQKSRADIEAEVVEAAVKADAAEGIYHDDAPTPEPTEPAGETEPGQDVGNDQSQGAETSSGATTPSDSGDQEPAAESKPKNAMRKAVENRLFTLFSGIPAQIGGGGKITRDERIAVYRQVLKRDDITSTEDLDNVQVAKVCDQVFEWGQAGKLGDEINEIRNAIAIAEAAAGGE